MLNLTQFEKDVMNYILSGDNEVLSTLRDQYSKTEVINKEYTGGGFFLYFKIPPNLALKHKQNFIIDDVYVENIQDLKLGGGFILYVKDGLLDALEGYCYDLEWPEKDIMAYHLYYTDHKNRDIQHLVEKVSS